MLATLPGAWFARRMLAPIRRSSPGIPLQALLGEQRESDAFERAIAVRQFEFPRDHGAHPQYRHEWWYFTGNLLSADGRPFGFQLTFFRLAIAPDVSPQSKWRAQHLILAHFALADIRAQRFFPFERLHRSALAIAGFESEPPTVWLKDWRVTLQGETKQVWKISARTGDYALDLALTSAKGTVLQGDQGLSRKGAAIGNASYYYSQPRLSAAGNLSLNRQHFSVTGAAWLDREWGTSALDSTQSGWDWFGLQFDNHCELMFYRLRRVDGASDRHSAGVWIPANGEVVSLNHEDVTLISLDTWTSADSQVTYPRRWRIEIPSLGIRLRLNPRIAAQEWTGRVAYWEGAVEVSGSLNSTLLNGLGYAEYTGYA